MIIRRGKSRKAQVFMKKAGILTGILIALIFLNSCQTISKKETEGEALDFQIVEEDKIPEEMVDVIAKEQDGPFQIVYGDGEQLYIGQGYGIQEMEGYSIKVDLCREGEDAIYVHTALLGPGSVEAEEDREDIFMREDAGSAVPYVVFSVKWSEKQVIFDVNEEEKQDGTDKEASAYEFVGKDGNGSVRDR